jgi:hypothetical protein
MTKWEPWLRYDPVKLAEEHPDAIPSLSNCRTILNDERRNEEELDVDSEFVDE